MFGVFLATLLTIAILLAARAFIWFLTARRSPMDAVWREAAITQTVRRESADLDREYEFLLRP